jgi:hypothetical protein
MVSARKEEAEVLYEPLSPGAWRRHQGGAAALTVVDRRSRVTRQQFAGEAAGEGMQWQLTEAWMEHLGMGHGRNFTGGQCGEEPM